MIQLFHVSKEYIKNQRALNDINLEIKKGEFVFITGASGAGKSSLLKIIYAQERPTQGQLLIDSLNVNLIPDHKLYTLRRQLGIVFQDFKLLLNRTVYENVAIPLIVRGENRATIDKKVSYALSLVNLTHRKRFLAGQISGGEQQRTAIARAIVSLPKIIIADEPTGNLDTELSIEIFKIFERINSNNITTIIATHDQNLLKLFPKRTIKLDKGKIVEEQLFR